MSQNKKVSQLDSITPAGTDLIYVVRGGVGYKATVSSLVGSNGLLVVSSPPAGPTSPGNPNEIFFDSNWAYLCVSTNTWRRWPLSVW